MNMSKHYIKAGLHLGFKDFMVIFIVEHFFNIHKRQLFFIIYNLWQLYFVSQNLWQLFLKIEVQGVKVRPIFYLSDEPLHLGEED